MSAIDFTRHEITLAGTKMEYLEAGEGEPLVFFHGAGLIGGWDFAKEWAKTHRVILPHHPGWAGSDDGLTMTRIQDLVMHHLEFVDALGLEKFNLLGFSMGGWLASTFATQHAHRLNKLILVAPAGLRVPTAPSLDLFTVENEDVLSYLVHDMACLAPFAPEDPTSPDFIAGLYREGISFARFAWDRMWDENLPKWLHRINVPTLLLWGEEDRVVPFGQAQVWADHLPDSRIVSFADIGHLPFVEGKNPVKAVADFLQ